MDNPILWIVGVAVLLFLIWLWNRRSARGGRGDPYDGSSSVNPATYPAAQVDPPGQPAAPASAPAAGIPRMEARVSHAGAEAARPVSDTAAGAAVAPVPATVQESPAPAARAAPTPSAPPLPAEAPEPKAAPAAAAKQAEPDDLTAIEGIGPKISRVLRGAGIRTYAQLAAMKPAAIKQVLTDSGVRVGDPATWPRQAKLAADGKWEKLKTLQDNLKGGRKV